MTTEQKIIRAKVGLLELAKQLGDSYSAGGRGGGGKQDTNKGSINLGAWPE